MHATEPHQRRPLGLLLALTSLGAVLGCSATAWAIGSSEWEDASIDATGYLRLTGAYLHYRELPPPLPSSDDGLLTAVLRLMLEGYLGEVVQYESNLFLDLSHRPTTGLTGAFASAGSFESSSPYRADALTWSFWERGEVAGALGVDRLNMRFDADPVVLTVGRFPVNYSVTNLFTPNDFFAPFSATAINTVYKPGVDALRLSLSLGTFSGIEVVRVIGYEPDGDPTWGRSALLARASTTHWDFEWALLGGKLAERWVAGASLQGELGPIALRGEGHVGFADADGDGRLDSDDATPSPLQGQAGHGRTLGREDVHGRLAMGIDAQLEWQNLWLGAEYAFLSDGTTDPAGYLQRAARLYPDDLPWLGQHYVGASIRGEIIPILTAGVLGVVGPQDGSGLAAVSLQYNVADEAEFVGGMLIPWGASPAPAPAPQLVALESEFGLMPLTVFAETRFYF